jgi:Coenzyme PQQ synthesis protein D (PqqD)
MSVPEPRPELPESPVLAMSNDELRLREADLSWRQVGDEVIVLDLRSNAYLSINRSGVTLWEMLVDGSTTATMADRLVSEFGLEEEQARADVDAFVTMLTERDLLQ